MIEHQGIWLPDHERHLQEWMTRRGEIVDGRGTYQIKKLRQALSYCTGRRTAVDVGAHVGLWSMHLVKEFYRVVAFEPVEEHRECFVKNLMGYDPDYLLVPCALGDHEGSVSIRTTPTSSGDSRVVGEGDVPLDMLDNYGLGEVDFIKLDCEGYELFALRGGEATIKRCSPVIIVEQKPGKGQQYQLSEKAAVDYLVTLGYHCVWTHGGDHVMVPQ